MFLLSSGDLVDLLEQHALLTPEQLTELPNLMHGRASDGRALAKVLVHRGWISPYQGHLLVSGKGKELALGKYRILDMLGQGGLSRVFKARHTEYQWTVALKVIRPEVLTSSEGRQQFLQEMEAMARLDHPNIVQFCDVDQSENNFYFAMEYVDGTDLGRLVQRMGPLPVYVACDFVRQVALGLQHAHERNLVHRDIKPANLFLTHPRDSDGLASDESVIKILDWGLASLRPPGQGPAESQAKYLIGTVDYLAPEQALNPDAASVRSDIYSLGGTLYYLLTGQVLFPEGTITDKLRKHQEEEPPAIRQFRNDLPVGFAMVLKRMLAKRPEDRFRTPDAVALALGPYARRPITGAGQDFLSLSRARGADGATTPSSLTSGPRSMSRFSSHTLFPPGETCFPEEPRQA